MKKPKKPIEIDESGFMIAKPVKNKIRKKGKIIFHKGEGEFPFGFALSGMLKDFGGIYEAKTIFDQKGTLIGISFDLNFPIDARKYDASDIPENYFIAIQNQSRERDEFFTIHLNKSVISKFNVVGNDFTLVKCRIDKSIVKIYLSEPIDIAKKLPPGTVSWFHDVILYSDDIYEKILEFVNSDHTKKGPKQMRIEINVNDLFKFNNNGKPRIIYE
jgi:hypothetical protein